VVNSIGDRSSAVLENRSVVSGSSVPGAITEHTFKFDLLGIPTVGSVVMEYCSNTPLIDEPCDPPSGLDTSAATLISQIGPLDFSLHPNTALSSNRIVVTRAISSLSATPVGFTLGNITNPDGSSPTIYVRISTYTSDDGTGLYDNNGSVTFSVQSPLTVSVYVPPYIAMCTGVTVSLDCSATNGSTVDLGELSKTNPTTGTTQFAVATNSINGYVAMIQGSTMTAGNRIIASLPVRSASQGGVSQFGINLRANSSPAVGQDVEGAGTGAPSAEYGIPNQFKYVDGDTLASSPLPSDWNRYTISYLVNVGDSQQAGRYATTMTVIATTTF
jgi:hypothetical protein